MNIIDRYLGKALLQTIFVVLLAVLGIEMFIAMVGELGEIGRSHYTIMAALYFVLLNLPTQLYALFPMIGLVGMLMGLGVLANHSELVILQSVGLSPLRITLGALKTIVILLVLVGLVGELAAPRMSHMADQYKGRLLQNIEDHKTGLAYDLWARAKNDYFYIKEVDEQKQLRGINWFRFDAQGQLIQSSTAKTAIYQHNQWWATDLQQTTFGTQQVQVTAISQAPLPLDMTPQALISSNQNPNALSLTELENSLHFHATDHVVDQTAQLSFWRRLIQPLASLVMMLLAIPFVFGPLRQSSQSVRLVIGLILGFCFYYANQFFGPISLLFHWPAFIGAAFPTLLFGLVGVFLLRSQKQ